MGRILVIGGYGGFGARVSRRLAEAGYEVLVAGRNLEKARAFAAGSAGLIPLAVDRTEIADALAAHHPQLLIDAAGPFQGADYKVVRACIAAGVHYLDLADGREFVTGIAAFDVAARQAKVAVISGASSVPALSGAVARSLADGLDEVRAVDIAISASNRATIGPSVAKAILSYVGRPIPLWRGKRWSAGHGWQESRKIHFEASGTSPVRNRRVALCDVPDLVLLPERLRGSPAVAFRAGTELALHHWTLWAASWPVRWGWIANLSGLAPILSRVQRMTAFLGTDRSAMRVRIAGVADGQRVDRAWTLIANHGAGPEIPSLAASILAPRILEGAIGPGARDAGGLLALDDFAPALDALGVVRERRESPVPPPLYARVMGARFAELPFAVRYMHDVLRDGGAFGRATVTRGRNPLARLASWIVGFPPAGEHDLHVHFEEDGSAERWTRDFSGHRFTSRLSQRGRYLVEHFGPLAFGFDLPSDAGGLAMEIRAFWVGPVRLPLALAPRCRAREWEEDGRFQFDVPVSLPLIGLVAHYRGWLELKVEPVIQAVVRRSSALRSTS